ncbi:hypothetical protein [Peribacillus acanthi]|uniref:hypothetical protein n=1 Tax=Peribacillus acanthi TaxID=2171554 RepID=UPI000D3EB8F6|nr:hypothetical protein [Peribacillus acanthi]
MAKAVYCDKCYREVEVRGDLVTTTMFLEVVPYHEECYAKDLKGVKTFLVSNQPLNGFSGNFTAIVALLFMLGMLVFAEESLKWMSFLAIIPIIYRLYSYIVYERHLDK